MRRNDELTTDGVRVEKHVEREELPLPSIVYELTNDRSEELRIRFVEAIPESTGPEHIGFPSEERDAWRVDDGRIVHETTLEADSSTSAAFGLRPEAAADLEQFLSEPETVEIWTPLTAADGGESEEVHEAPSAQPRPAEEAPAPPEPTSSHSGDVTPTGEDRQRQPREGGATTTGGGEPVEAPGDGAAIVGQVVDALRSGDVAPADLASLREELGVPERPEEAESSASVDARIRSLQTELADLRAYRAALEEFLDEEGTATEVIDRIDSRLDSFEERLDGVESSLEHIETSVENLESTVASTAAGVESNEAAIESNETAIESNEAAIESNEAAIESNEAGITTNEEAVAEVAAEVDGLSDGMATVDSRLDDTSAEVESLSSAVDHIEDSLPPADLPERVDEIEGQVAAVDDETATVADRLEAVDDRVGSLRNRVAENEGELSQVRELERKLERVFGAGED